MARPRDEELDEKIIQSAADEFHQNGYGPMTLASVAKKSRCQARSGLHKIS